MLRFLTALSKNGKVKTVKNNGGSFEFVTTEEEQLQIYLNQEDLSAQNARDPHSFRSQLNQFAIEKKLEKKLPVKKLAIRTGAAILAALSIAGAGWAINKLAPDKDREEPTTSEFMEMIHQREAQEEVESWYKEQQRQQASQERQDIQEMYDHIDEENQAGRSR